MLAVLHKRAAAAATGNQQEEAEEQQGEELEMQQKEELEMQQLEQPSNHSHEVAPPAHALGDYSLTVLLGFAGVCNATTWIIQPCRTEPTHLLHAVDR